MSEIMSYAIPAFVGLLSLEVVLSARNALDAYEGRDTAASLSMGLGNLVVAAAMKVLTVPMFFFLYEHRLFDLGTGATAFVLLFFAEDFTYYWFHRGSHEVRFLWAAHVNHHSSQRYNLGTALRQSWTTPFTTLLFYWPLPLLGFHPVMIATAVSLSLIYQFWIHTELIGRLPAGFEWVFNTPSHHRVHHGSNVEYLDRNHGGILIVWDRLFGTFEPEAAPVRYGLTKNIETFNPFRIAAHEWVALWRDMRKPAPWSTRLMYALAPPGWQPDASSSTSRELRDALASGGAAQA
jgi:sterol desaturase/sphingolipid hydroxylase (fatty acid hydroxylase superfamily)